MRKRIHVKKRYNIKNKDLFVIIAILVALITIIFFIYFNNKALPIIKAYAESETINTLGNIIMNSTSEIEYDVDNIYVITKNSDEEIVSVDFNNVVINKLLGDINQKIQKNMELYHEKEEVNFFTIPLGVTKNGFISVLGPKIPVKLKLSGSVQSMIQTQIKEYGINNALLQINIYVEVKEIILLPFLLDDVIIKLEIPVVTKLINGKIPQAYGGVITNSSNITSLPE